MKKALNDCFPDAQQQICIHHINSNVLLRSKQKWIQSGSDSSSSDQENASETPQAQSTLTSNDRAMVRQSGTQDGPLPQDDTSDPIPHDYKGILMLWRLVVFAETEEAHEKAWIRLCKEFNDQKAILLYLYRTYMPVRAQWARCFIRRYRNFGIRVTSGTEASNNNVKSYLLNGMSHLYRLVEAIQDMLGDQERDFIEACAQDEVLTPREFLGRGAEYLGELPMVISRKGLRLVASQHRFATKAMPKGTRPWPAPMGLCDDNCSVSLELGIPCCHTILLRLESNTPFTKWDIHPRWHLRASTLPDPYRRILDPNIAISLRGRPKNTAQAAPDRLAVEISSQPKSSQQPSSQPRRGKGRPRGSRNKSTLLRLELATSQANQEENSQPAGTGMAMRSRGSRTRTDVLGSGRTTGVRATGQRTQPSVRRRRSQWELLISSDDEHSSRRTRSSQKS
jgi:hypothetical protein